MGNVRSIGIFSPLTRDATYGFWKPTLTSIDTIKANLRHMLKTRRGEVPMLRDFGCSPEDYLFENRFDKEGYSDLIKSQTSKYFPMISIQKISIRTKDDDISLHDNAVHIKLWFVLRDVSSESQYVEIEHEMNQAAA